MNAEIYADSAPPESRFAEPELDERHALTSRIMACLRDRIPDLERVHVTVIGNTAAMRGTLRSQHDKRLCLECCRHVPGVRRVVDELIIAEEIVVECGPRDTIDIGPKPR